MRYVVITLCVLLAFPAAVRAQEPQQEPTVEERLDELDQKIRVLDRKTEIDKEAAAEKAKTAGQATAGRDGFNLKSADGNFQLKLRGYVQLDGRFFQSDDQRPGTDTFTLRRVRPILDGTVYKIFDFRIMPDFGGGQTVLQDAYLEARFNPAFRVRAGKLKPPVGLERLQSGTDLLFVERAFPTNLVPNRDLGIQLGGDVAGGVANWAVGVFNGVLDKKVFDPAAGTWGAFEIAARYHKQELDDETFPTFTSITSSASAAEAWAVGFNWYFNRNLRLLFDYETTSFEGGAASGDREDEKILFSRFQIAF